MISALEDGVEVAAKPGDRLERGGGCGRRSMADAGSRCQPGTGRAAHAVSTASSATRQASGAALFQLLKRLDGRVDRARVDLGRARFAGAGAERVGAGLGQRDPLFLLAFVELDGDRELGCGERLGGGRRVDECGGADRR